jgi:hypothetical protein
MISGSLASVVLGFLHRGDKTRSQQRKSNTASKTASSIESASGSGAETGKGKEKASASGSDKSSKGKSGGTKLRKQKK